VATKDDPTAVWRRLAIAVAAIYVMFVALVFGHSGIPSFLERGPLRPVLLSACPTGPASQVFTLDESLTLAAYDPPDGSPSRSTSTVAIRRGPGVPRCFRVDGPIPDFPLRSIRFQEKYWRFGAYRLVARAVTANGDRIWFKVSREGAQIEYWLPTLR